MAGLKDSSGQIVINDREAEADIRKINNAKRRLENVIDMLDPSKLDDNKLQGETKAALEDQLHTAISKLKDLSNQCEAIVRYIRGVVTVYKAIDKAYANQAREQ